MNSFPVQINREAIKLHKNGGCGCEHVSEVEQVLNLQQILGYEALYCTFMLAVYSSDSH